MSDLSQAAAALGVSEAIVQRSAEARAKATGTSVDEVLKAWAGGGSLPTESATQTASPEPPASSHAEEETKTESAPSAPATVAEPKPVAAAAAYESSELVARRSELAAPKEVSPKEALRYPVVVTIATSGLKERTISSVPKWLASLFVIIPMFGLLQLAGATSNECGEGAELLPDRVSGALENCDGTPFEGRGEIGGGVDFIALGEQVFRGQVVAAANCQGCHGAQGQGGSGPPLGPVLATFSSCVDHLEWVSKGTPGFQAEGRATYGDLKKPVGGVGTMPSFATQLSPEQIAAVVTFERVRFGGAGPDQALADCGLVEAPPEGATGGQPPPPSPGEPPGEGAQPTTTPASTTTGP